MISRMRTIGQRMCSGASLSDVQSEIAELNSLASQYNVPVTSPSLTMTFVAAIKTHRSNLCVLKVDATTLESLEKRLIAAAHAFMVFEYPVEWYYRDRESFADWDYYRSVQMGKV